MPSCLGGCCCSSSYSAAAARGGRAEPAAGLPRPDAGGDGVEADGSAGYRTPMSEAELEAVRPTKTLQKRSKSVYVCVCLG